MQGRNLKMKIAVTYDNGSVFQHFGKTENFKIFEVENGAIISSEVVGSNGAGHSALAGFLADAGVDVVIYGDVNEAAESYVNGTLECTSEGNCDHHHEEGGHCCHGEESEESGCEGGCGGCHGGCGTPEPIMEGKNVGKKCRTHYKGTFNDGTQFDSSYDRGEPLEFICGVGQMIKGFDQAVANMEVGESVEIHLMPEEAYGMPDPAAIFTLEIAQLPGSEELEAGQQVYLSNQFGQPFPVKVVAKDDKTITFDANHEMAGKELNFTIELVSVEA